MTGEPAGNGVPGYVLRELIGVGRSSHVWRAEPREHPGRVVAIKRLPLAPGPRALAAFRRLTARVAELSHPSILPVLGVIDHEHGVALVMPYAPGGTLADRLVRHGGGLPPAVVADLGADLASALAAAHGAGLVHGAVATSNVLFDAEGRPLLTDFGVTVLLAGAGPPSAPSAAADRPVTAAVAPAARRDIRGLGSTLHTALSGAPSDRRGYLEPRSTEPLRHTPLTMPIGTPGRLATAIERAIHDDPAGTTTTAADLAAELRDVRHGAEDPIASAASPRSPPSGGAALEACARTPPRPRLARWQHARASSTGDGASPGGQARVRSPRIHRWDRRLLVAVAALVVATPFALAALTASTRGQPSLAPSATEEDSDRALGTGALDRVPPDPCDGVAIDGSGNRPGDVVADVDGIGCGVPIVWADGQLIVPSTEGLERRFDLDADRDDVLLAGDWTCDGRDGIALYRPASGEVFRFDRVDEQDGEVLATAERIGEPGGQPRVVTDADGCDRIVVDTS